MIVAGLVAMLAGLASFISPCVLPLVPGYLSFISGVSLDALEDNRGRVLTASALFVLGFAVIFVAMGASASLIGGFLNDYRLLVQRIGGGFVILFGLSLIGVIDLPFFGSGVSAGKSRLGLAGALPLGMSFAIAWTPCVSYNLAPIIVLASQAETVGRGAALLAFYALGLGVPFILTGAFFAKAGGALRWLNKRKETVGMVAGGFLIAMGLLMLSGQLGNVFQIVQRVMPSLEVKI